MGRFKHSRQCNLSPLVIPFSIGKLYLTENSDKQLIVDLSTVIATPPIKDQDIVVLGCKVQGSDKKLKDMNNPRTYASASPNTANRYYQANGIFKMDPATVAGLDQATFHEEYLKVNNPAVAKLLVTIANLISPEIAQTA